MLHDVVPPFQNRPNQLAHRPDPFAVDDSHLKDAARPAFVQIVADEFCRVARVERVKVEHAVDRQFDRLAFDAGFRRVVKILAAIRPLASVRRFVVVPDHVHGASLSGAPILRSLTATRRGEGFLKKQKRKLARSGKFSKARGPQGPIRDAEAADDHVHDSHRIMRGRDNEATLSADASRTEIAGDVRPGQVVAIRGPIAVVESTASADPADASNLSPSIAAAALVECTLRKSTRVPHPRATALVAGDFVTYLAEGAPPFTMTEVSPRRSRLARVRGGDEQVVVANVDLGVIVASAVDPVFKPRLVDRYLLAAADGGLTPVLVLNKSDLLPAGEAAALLVPYGRLEFPAVAVSVTSGEGLDRLRELLRGKSSVFAGQSGVGKSSLVNALVPDLDARVGEIQEHTGKGRHTTTASTLYRFPFGGWVVDTPGIRSFALGEPRESALREFFPEIFEVAATCRFSDCRHTGDLGCAMPAALRSGLVHPDRLDSFLVLVRGPSVR